ncbi:MAG: hypothetical protein WC451_03455 [Patescibacteria group bacterium]
MKEVTVSEKTIIIFSLVLSILVVTLFLWIWFSGKRPSVDSYRSSEDLAPVNVVGLESQAEKLLEGLKNNSGIPIPEPTAKEGRTDPFAAI